MAFILAVLSLYWGVFYQVETRLTHLSIYVVDFDGTSPYDTGATPLVGPTITRLIEQTLNSGQPTLGYTIRPPSEFGNDPLQVRQAVYDFDAWAAVIINPNATSMLYSAIANGNASYDPMGACQLVYQDSRDETNWFDFMLPLISAFLRQAQSSVGREWAGLVLQNASDPTVLANMQAVPQALNPAIGFSEYNLRPFFPYTGIPAVSIGLICKFATRRPPYIGLPNSIFRPDYHIVLLVLLLSAHPHAIHQSQGPSAAQILAIYPLALDGHNQRVLHAVSGLLACLIGFPGQLLALESDQV